MMTFMTPFDALIPKMPFSCRRFFIWSCTVATGWSGNGLTAEPHPWGVGGREKGALTTPAFLEQFSSSQSPTFSPGLCCATELELQLWEWEAFNPDYIVSRKRIPLSQIPGFAGEPVMHADKPHNPDPEGQRTVARFEEYKLEMQNLQHIQRHVKDVGRLLVDKADQGRESFKERTGNVWAKLYFDTSYEQAPGPSLGILTIALEDIIMGPSWQRFQSKTKLKTSRTYMVINCGRHWAWFGVSQSDTQVNINRTFKMEVCGGTRLLVTHIVCARAQVRVAFVCRKGGGGLPGGNFSPRDISRFKFVRSFPHNFQAAVRNKPASKFSKISGPTIWRRGTVDLWVVWWCTTRELI